MDKQIFTEWRMPWVKYYPSVDVKKSNSSSGNYVVKISDITFRFFWHKAQAQAFSDAYNGGVVRWLDITTQHTTPVLVGGYTVEAI